MWKYFLRFVSRKNLLLIMFFFSTSAPENDHHLRKFWLISSHDSSNRIYSINSTFNTSDELNEPDRKSVFVLIEPSRCVIFILASNVSSLKSTVVEWRHLHYELEFMLFVPFLNGMHMDKNLNFMA